MLKDDIMTAIKNGNTNSCSNTAIDTNSNNKATYLDRKTKKRKWEPKKITNFVKTNNTKDTKKAKYLLIILIAIKLKIKN